MLRRAPLKARSKKRIAKDRLLGKVKRQLWARCNGHCEVPWCKEQANDAHHVIKRSHGGAHTITNLVALCRQHHDDTDRTTGRLFVGPTRSPMGGYGFGFEQRGRIDSIGPFTLEA